MKAWKGGRSWSLMRQGLPACQSALKRSALQLNSAHATEQHSIVSEYLVGRDRRVEAHQPDQDQVGTQI